MIKQTWKRLLTIHKQKLESAEEPFVRASETIANSGYTLELPKSTCSNAFKSIRRAFSEGTNAVVREDRGRCLLAAPFMNMMEMMPVFGSGGSILVPLGGVTIGTATNLAMKAALTPAEMRVVSRQIRRLGFAATAVAGVFVATHLKRVPESNRFRLQASWPWSNEDEVASMDPFFEALLEQRVLPASHKTATWVSGVFDKLKKGNLDVDRFADNWNLKVIDKTIPALLCFVIPEKRDIWMTEFYLGLVDDESQLAYVIGHELGHVICQHAKDFLLIDLVKEAGLFALGIMAGWTIGANILREPTMSFTQTVYRAGRYIGFVGLLCYVTATALNLGWVLPYRRKLELESDVVGFKFAAKACFKLDSVPDHWQTLDFDGATPQWRSTHPSAKLRERLLKDQMSWGHKVAAKHGCDK